MQLSAIDLNQLVVLRALLATESVKDSARLVGLSPSAVSHALAGLRVQLSDPLLVRAGQRLVMTPRARELQPRLEAALRAVEAAVAPPEPFDPATARRRFSIVCTDHAEVSVLRALGRRLLDEAPGVDLHSRAVGGIHELLRDGRADLGIGVAREVPPDIHTEHLFDETFVTLMRRGHPALDGPWTPEAFAALDHVLVAPRGQAWGVLDDVLQDLGLQRRLARVVGTFLVAPFLVEGTDLVVTLPKRAAEAVAPGLDLVARPPPGPLATGFQVSMLWHRRDEAEPAHVWLRSALRAATRS